MRAAALLLLLAGCHHAPPPPDEVAPVLSATPIDRTLPGELAIGTDDAFGLPVPRYMKPKGRFADAVFFEGRFVPERIANFVRQHVTATHVDTGPVKTVFSGVEVKGQPGRTLHVEVIATGGGTVLYVRDETRASANDGKTPDERMRSVGLNPDGTLLDPTHLE